MKYYSVHIPTRPHLYKYLTAQEGAPVIMNNTSPFCIFFSTCLSKNLHSGLSSEDLNTRLRSFTESITVKIPLSNFYRYGFSVSPHQIISINRFLEKTFERELVNYCSMFIDQSQRYAGYKEAYETFAEKYNIDLEIDIDYDTLKKIEYRSRKKTLLLKR